MVSTSGVLPADGNSPGTALSSQSASISPLRIQNTSTPTTPLTFIEFFSGVGLVNAALSGLGWTCLFANDNDPKKNATYLANYPTANLVDYDIQLVNAVDIPKATLATASFPCVDLSQAGNRRGINGEHSGVVWSFLRRIETLVSQGRAPRYLLLENVPGLLTLHEGSSIDILLRNIAKLGYAFDLVQVDARHFVPQARNRVFIIAGRGLPTSPFSLMPDDHIHRYKVRQAYERNRNLPWHFFNFPSLPKQSPTTLADIIEPTRPDDPRWWPLEKLDYFWSHLEHDHAPRLAELLKAGEHTYLTAVRRGRRRGPREQIFNLRFDGLA
ncbi:MAG: DNA (cytosine-5-)-methyltransferase, partial [Propionibacteriaceae bacterium]|nr:DNA (cytosine-5-)-methyltransferase [Propionibacteriaceae bacterium]